MVLGWLQQEQKELQSGNLSPWARVEAAHED